MYPNIWQLLDNVVVLPVVAGGGLRQLFAYLQIQIRGEKKMGAIRVSFFFLPFLVAPILKFK